MACKEDVKLAILNQVMKELEGRYTYTRTSEDTIQINGRVDNSKTKAKSANQAFEIAKEIADRTNKSFLKHVRSAINQNSKYEPVTVTFNVSDSYINHVFNSMASNQKSQANELADKERDYVNTNTGPNSYQQIEMFDVEVAPEVGAFSKLIELKSTQLIEYKRRLSNTQRELNKANLTKEQRVALNKKERELKLKIEGNEALGIDGLEQEIAQMSKDADISSVGYYVERDLETIKKLVSSNDVEDLKEARRLIDFYTLAGTFRTKVENPFFTQEEIFFTDENGEITTDIKLPESVRQQYEDWAKEAQKSLNIIDAAYESITVRTFNNDPGVNRTFAGKKFTYQDIINNSTGLKDIDWISMWVMDVTQGIFSHNGLMPQVMFSTLANSFEKKLTWSKKIAENIDRLTPLVQKELSRLGYTLRAGGILGLAGANYQLFKEVSKEGNESGGLVRRYNKEYYDEEARVKNKFSEKYKEARLEDSWSEVFKQRSKAFEDLKKWRRDNSIIMDINKLPEFSANGDAAYKQHLIDILGQKGYDEQVAEQKRMLIKYEAERQSTIEVALTIEGKNSYDELSETQKAAIAYWESGNSPYRGIEDFESVDGITLNDRKVNNFMVYNNFIPRKKQVTVGINKETRKYTYTETNRETDHYNSNYKTIEDNPILLEYYNVIKEVCETVREYMPYEQQLKMSANTVPSLMKASTEIIADNSTGILSSLFEAFKHMIERLRLSFGVNKQSEVSYATIDSVTGKANYKVNNQFLKGNLAALEQRRLIETTSFLQAINQTRTPENRVKAIKKFSSFPLSSLNEPALVELAKFLHIQVPLSDIKAGRLDAFRNITGDRVEIGKYIRDYSLHTVVQTQSFDLSKIAKHFSNLTMMYAAREEALPTLEIMKAHYESIQAPKTNKLGANIYNAVHKIDEKAGVRTNAIRQMDDWFERVVLGNYNTKHAGAHGNPTKVESVINNKTKGLVPKYFNDIYSREDKKKLKEIQELLANESDEITQKRLVDLKDSLGRQRTATAFFDNLLAWIRTMRLGYNLSSGTTNFMEGLTSNMILASLNEYFDPKEIYYGYGVMKYSFLKNISFGKVETASAKKNRSLMDKFRVIMDSKNELQKASVKTYSDRLEWANPHAINQRIEFMNQSPIMIAMLRTQKIKDTNGNESSIWDAYQPDGHLKPEFRTEENIENWENLSGEDYLVFKQRLHKAIVLGHGNYDELRGMMIKSSTGGKALAMFKTWLPMQLYWRFGVEQDDIQTGSKFKGRYRSYGAGSALIHGIVAGTAMFGLPVGAGIGVGTMILGKFFGTDSGVGILQETVYTTKALVRKMLGMPVNIIVGKQIIDTGDKTFDKWVGKGKFTTTDAKNLRGNMADIAGQLAILAMILMVKGLFWDDDDKPEDAERITHNILINKLMMLSSQASTYINPVALYKSVIGDNAAIKYLEDVAKWLAKAKDAIEGNDIIQSGRTIGESGLGNQTKKILLPGLFKDGNPVTSIVKGEVPFLGFESQSKTVFTESPFHEMFKSDEKKDKEANKRERASRKLQLEEENENITDKEIRKILDYELPTPSQLEKKELTRDEYEDEVLGIDNE